jgi:hypothetical protein
MQVGGIFNHEKNSSINGVRALEQHIKIEKQLEKSMAQEIARNSGIQQRRKQNSDNIGGRHGDASAEDSQNGDGPHSSEALDAQALHLQRQQEMMIPPESERIREEVVKRLNLQREWQERRLVLSDKFLWVTLIGHDVAVDKIPLVP